MVISIFLLLGGITFYPENITPGIILSLLFVLVFLFFSALVSGSEIAFFSLTPAQLKKLKESKSPTDKTIIHLLSSPKKLLANILIVNNFVNVSIVILLSFVLRNLFDFGTNSLVIFLIEVVLITSLVLLFGEIMPKVLATQRPLPFARFMASPFRVLSAMFMPLSALLISSTSLIDRKIAKKSYNISMDELSQAINLTTSTESENSENQTTILRGIAKFSDTDAKEIMHSRLDVTAVDNETSFPELLKVVQESGFSRIPVYRESFDNIVGILYIKDLLPYLGNEEFDWQTIIRPAYFVPESKKISDLLTEFQAKKIHLAIVVDEYGGTSGIVTLEDVIEEIVGDINDEFDTDGGEFVFSRIDEHNYLFDAKTSLIDFCRITGIDESGLDDIRGDAESLAGLILEQHGRIPRRHEEFVFGKLGFKVESADNRRIKQLKVTIRD